MMILEARKPDRTRRVADRADYVKRVVAAVFNVAMREIDAPTRSRAHIAFARQTAMYLCNVACGMSLTEVAQQFGRDRTTVSHACHLVEDRRDDDSFDQLLEHLETDIRRTLGAPAAPRVAVEAKAARDRVLEFGAAIGAFQ